MGLFNKKKEGGILDVIRCDQEEYLVWKWRPVGADVNSTKIILHYVNFRNQQIMERKLNFISFPLQILLLLLQA